MEEILASIRRIIADDDPSRSAPKANRTGCSCRHRGAAPPPPRMARSASSTAAGSAARAGGQAGRDRCDARPVAGDITAGSLPRIDEPASDILDLTEQMAASQPASSAGAFAPSTASRTWCSRKRAGAACSAARCAGAASSAERAATAASSRLRPRPRPSIPPSIRSPRRCWCRTAARSRTWSGNAAADAQDLARRQSAEHGRAPGARRDRASLARPRRRR